MTYVNALERALPIVAAAYGEQFGVKVVLSGQNACTDGKTIVLPLLDNMTKLKDVLFGYLAHESAHIRDTDFDVIYKCRNASEKSFLNLVEDIRIEGEIQHVFPGTQFTLSAMEQYIFDQGWTPVPSAQDNEASILIRYLYHRMYGEVLKRACYSSALIEESKKVVEQVFPSGIFVRLDVIFSKYMHTLSSTRECLKVARLILKAIKEAEEEEKPSDSGESENTTDDTAKDGKAQSNNQEPSNDENDKSDSSETSFSGEQSSETNDDAVPENQSADLSLNGDSDNSESGESLHEIVMQETDLPKDVMDNLKGQLQDQAKEDGTSQCHSIDTSNIGQLDLTRGSQEELQAGILSSSAVRSKLQGLLQAQTREKKWLHTRGKRVDGKRLSRAAMANPFVFIQRDIQKRPDTAVHVLLDNSGSMYDRQQTANQAAVSLALAVSSIPKCDIAVSAFPGLSDSSVCPIIQRGQSVRACLNRFDIQSTGSTPLAEAMLFSAGELAKSRREKKVLIIVTDGDPDDAHTVRYMSRVIEGHIDVYAIGIQSNSVSCLFKNWTVINDVKELQSSLFDIAGKVLALH